MDDKRIDKAAAFDTLFTNNRIQILKTLAYYIDPHLLKGLAVYIKFLELQYTLALFRKHPETALHSFPLSSDGSCFHIFPPFIQTVLHVRFPLTTVQTVPYS